MDMTDKYDALVLKGAKFQVIINAVINSIVGALSISTAYVAISGSNSMIMDFIIMNFFLIFFVLFFTRNEVEKWSKKNNARGVWYKENKHKDLKKYLNNGFFKNFALLFIRYSITMTIPAVVLCSLIYADSGIPAAHFVFIKGIYSVFLANKVATLGGRLGSIDQTSIKLAQI